MRLKSALLLATGLWVVGTPEGVANETPKPPKQQWSFSGPLGTYDRASLQRGFQVYKEVCSACHGLKKLSYRNLGALGYTPGQLKSIASQYQVTDGPNDEGKMFERPARLSDKIHGPFPNDNAARAANNGALPADLSLITKARPGGADYVYGLLTGFTAPPAGMKVPEGMHYNKYFPGHQIAMAAPLTEGGVTYSDGTKASIENMAHDVTTFLSWAAEPEMEDRKRTGVKVLAVLMVFTGLMYATMRRVWARVK